MNGIVWVLGGANGERGDVLAKGCTRSEPAEITEATLLCSNRSHPALQQRTTILKEHNVYVLRTDWTIEDNNKDCTGTRSHGKF